jgi:hypothetical protein
VVSDPVASRVLVGLPRARPAVTLSAVRSATWLRIAAFVVDQVLGHEHGQRPGEEADGEDGGDRHDGDDLSAQCSPSVPRHGRITACPAAV